MISNKGVVNMGPGSKGKRPQLAPSRALVARARDCALPAGPGGANGAEACELRISGAVLCPSALRIGGIVLAVSSTITGKSVCVRAAAG